MSGLKIIENFLEKAHGVQDFKELFQLMEDITKELGFHHFALISHGNLKLENSCVIRIENYPEVWARQFVDKSLYISDPILEACHTCNVGFKWTDVPKMVELNKRQRLILENAAKQGLRDGFTVPINIPGERGGSCSFATKSSYTGSQENLLLAQLIGAFGFHAARRISGIEGSGRRRLSSLTPRQRECLVWAIRGKTDWEIGQILGLSEETVTQYLNAARARYGVTKRMPLAVRAMFDGQISFIEAIF